MFPQSQGVAWEVLKRRVFQDRLGRALEHVGCYLERTKKATICYCFQK